MTTQQPFSTLAPGIARRADTAPLLLLDEGSIAAFAATDELWSRLQEDRRFHDHRLVSVFTYERSWMKRERHPSGSELVFVVDGRARFVLQGETETILDLAAGDWCVVPANTWHRAVIDQPTTMLFVTPSPAATIEEPIAAP